MEKEFFIKYEMTLADFEAFNVYVIAEAYRQSRISRYVVGAALLLFSAHAFYRAGFVIQLPSILFLLFASFWVFATPIIGIRSVKKRAAKIVSAARPGAVIGYREFVFAESHILLKSDLFDETIKWGAIQKIEATKKHVFVFLTDLGGYVIPCKEIETDTRLMNSFHLLRPKLQNRLTKKRLQPT